ncbi:MAG: alpha/beta fold hydrolase [Rubrobacteraceae bacterium]
MQQAHQKLRFDTTQLETGLQVHYVQHGDQTEEAIVFLHGYTDSWYSFSRVLPLLSPEHHAFALDQRGHGDSDKPENGYTADDFATDVVAFMDAVGIEKATLVGHSGGTLIAPLVALRSPQRVSCLVLIGPAIVGATGEAVAELGEEVCDLEDPVSPEFVREFQTSTIHGSIPDEFLETVISESLKLPARVWRDYLEGVMLVPDHVSQLAEIGAPTMILAGKQDAFFPLEEQERLAKHIPNATLKAYSDTGHAVHWERPEQVVRDLETFMRNTSSGSKE